MKRMNQEISLSRTVLGEGCCIYDVKENDKQIELFVQMDHKTCQCPHCGVETSSISTDYWRTIQHVPLKPCKKTVLHVHTYKLRCEHCHRIFGQPLSFARKSQVRTDALNMLVLAFSVFCSHEGCSRILREMGIDICADTIQNMISRIEFKDNPDVTEVMIDDASIRKGCSYVTLVYDTKTGELLAMLEGRDGESLKEWLRKHPKIEIVERDRASAYAGAIAEILPDCIQIADRFHLFQNLAQRLQKIVYASLPETIFFVNGEISDTVPKAETKRIEEDIDSLDYDLGWPEDENGNPVEIRSLSLAMSSPSLLKIKEKDQIKREKKVERIQQIRKESARLGRDELAGKYRLSAVTIERYLKMSEQQVLDLLNSRHKGGYRTSKYSFLKPLIFKMLRDGHELNTIVRFIGKNHMPDASQSGLYQYVYRIWRNNFEGKSLPSVQWVRVHDNVIRLKRYEILRQAFCMDEKKKVSQIQQLLPEIGKKYPALAWAQTVFSDFHSTLMGKDPGQIDVFVKKYETSAIEGFCESIKKDTAPVKNAVSHVQSSGPCEGRNNKFKYVKRIVYGRAGIINLEKRSKLAFLTSPANELLTRLHWTDDGQILIH